MSAVVILLAAGLVALALFRPRPEDAAPPAAPSAESTVERSADESEEIVETTPETVAESTPASDPEASPTAEAVDPKEAPETAAPAATPTPTTTTTTSLVARPPSTPAEAPTGLGGLDPEQHRFQIAFSRGGAGIESIVFSDFWTEASFARAADRHRADPEAPMPPEDERYRLGSSRYGLDVIPLLAARAVEIDGVFVSLFGDVWSEIEPGRFETEIVDESGTPRFRIERRFILPPNGYDLTVEQRVEHLGEAGGPAAEVRWIQYGPSDLDRDRGSFIEVRRLHFGYLFPKDRDPTQSNVTANGQLYERSEVLDRIGEWYGLPAQSITPQMLDLWPNDTSREEDLALSWFGATNRYFTICVHAVFDPPDATDRRITGSIESVRPIADLAAPTTQQTVVTELAGPLDRPRRDRSWDMGVYAGPLERSVLETTEPYVSLNMRDLIVYLMSGCCTFCTFSWLADFLVVFLSFLHGMVFDWAIAIVLLVCIVRLILHPLMRKGQIQMQRMGRLMSDLKPEIDALQKKYKDDPKRLQEEQRRMFMERGVNPMGCVGGLLPTFLQMPIWIALYAMLFFAFELRQEPAFFGVFQLLPDVQVGSATVFGHFLGDLSRPDHFIEFASPVDIWITKLTGFNILPILMGAIFFVQQKYMSPPRVPT